MSATFAAFSVWSGAITRKKLGNLSLSESVGEEEAYDSCKKIDRASKPLKRQEKMQLKISSAVVVCCK